MLKHLDKDRHLCFLSMSDTNHVSTVQINDRYEFPLQLDLDRENGKYLSPDADRSVRNLYTLHRFGTWAVISS